MSILTVILVLVVVGIVLWAINQFVPMEGSIKKILNAVIVIVVILWLLRAFNLLHYLTDLRV